LSLSSAYEGSSMSGTALSSSGPKRKSINGATHRLRIGTAPLRRTESEGLPASQTPTRRRLIPMIRSAAR
jgi:hypothetical protein